MSFAGKRFVLTGTASGIGAATAQILHEAGAEIIGLDRQSGAFVTQTLDLSDPNSIDRVCQEISGALDGIANIAGIPGTAAVDKIVAVNTLGLRRLTEALSGQLNAGSGIICVSSVTAERCTLAQSDFAEFLKQDWEGALTFARARYDNGTHAYEFSKMAVNYWMLTACAALAPHSVRVNCISPGVVDTAILQDFVDSIGQDRIDQAKRMTGRHGAADDIAEVIAFMLSDASRWINGVVLKVDGGLHGLRAAQAFLEKAP